MMMLMDAFQPEGVTRLAVDSIFMMPHLGVLAQVHEAAAEEVFVRDCLIPLGTCVAAVNQGKPGKPCFRYTLTAGDRTHEGVVNVGELALEPLGVGETGFVVAEPAGGIDLGEGRGRTLAAEVEGGVVGVVFDGRGRPLAVPEKGREHAVLRWARALGAYPT
jgi:hypothetical protein